MHSTDTTPLDVRDLNQRFERRVVRTGTHTVRSPDLCCDHDWAFDDGMTRELRMRGEPGGAYGCAVSGCDAVCVRVDGRIVDYEIPSVMRQVELERREAETQRRAWAERVRGRPRPQEDQEKP